RSRGAGKPPQCCRATTHDCDEGPAVVVQGKINNLFTDVDSGDGTAVGHAPEPHEVISSSGGQHPTISREAEDPADWRAPGQRCRHRSGYRVEQVHGPREVGDCGLAAMGAQQDLARRGAADVTYGAE